MRIPGFFLDDRQSDIIGSHLGTACERLAAFQLAAINKTLSHAKANSRFYKTHLKNVPAISTLKKFTGLPFTLPQQIQADSPSFLSVSQDEISRIVTLETSGTTASPKRFFFTASDLDATVEFFSRILSHLTCPGERGLVLLPGNTPASAGDLLKKALAGIGVKAIVPGLVIDFNDTLAQVLTHTPSLIIGLPVQVLALGELMQQGGHDTGNVRHIILTSDTVSSAVKLRVERAFGCPVFDHYGMTETGFGCGMECFARKGYHLRETDLYVEIIDPDTGETVPAGSWGEIVVTTLNRQGMPLVRYRTGDISRFLDAPCPCKSPFRRMDHIRYRLAHTRLLPNGLCFGMPDLDALLFKLPWVMDFQVFLGPGKDSALEMEMLVQTCTKELIENTAARKTEIQKIQQILSQSPLFRTAVETRALCIGSIQIAAFEFTDTYRGKRRIQDLGPGKPKSEN